MLEGETGAEGAPGLVGLVVFWSFSSSLSMLLFLFSGVVVRNFVFDRVSMIASPMSLVRSCVKNGRFSGVLVVWC